MAESNGGEKGFINVPMEISKNGKPTINIDDIREELKKGVIPKDNTDNVIKVDFQNKRIEGDK